MSYIPLVRFNPREISAFAHKKWTRMFIAALFIIVKNMRKSKWPTMDKCVNKLCYSCTVAYYPDVKKEHWYVQYGCFSKTYVDKRNHKQKNTHCIIPFI